MYRAFHTIELSRSFKMIESRKIVIKRLKVVLNGTELPISFARELPISLVFTMLFSN